MLKVRFGVFVMLSLALSPLLARAEDLTADQILERADRTRNGWNSFVVDVEITNYLNESVEKVSHYEVSIKGSDRSLVKFTDSHDRGKYLLTVDEFMWFYVPTASRPVRVTPLQRLTGNASNGDVAQTSLIDNYQPKLIKEEAVNGVAAYVLELTSKRKSSTYQSARYWISKSEAVPLKAEFRLTSGKEAKLSFFPEYQMVEGRKLLRRQEIYDVLRNNQKTVLVYKNYVRKELPDKVFNKNYRQEF